MENRKNVTRITGGLWKRTHVSIVPGFSVRPTPGRVRETIFNWIRQDKELANCRALDLFCGSGVLGLEALSRGCLSVSFVDKDKQCLLKIEQLLSRLHADEKAEFINDEASNWLEHSACLQYDLVFLDPPFSFKNPSIYLSKVKPFVKTNGLVYLEMNRSRSIMLESGVECWKSARAGVIHYGLYRILY